MMCFTMRVHSNLVGSVPGKGSATGDRTTLRTFDLRFMGIIVNFAVEFFHWIKNQSDAQESQREVPVGTVVVLSPVACSSSLNLSGRSLLHSIARLYHIRFYRTGLRQTI